LNDAVGYKALQDDKTIPLEGLQVLNGDSFLTGPASHRSFSTDCCFGGRRAGSSKISKASEAGQRTMKTSRQKQTHVCEKYERIPCCLPGDCVNIKSK
jgi:hypothetical protein